MKHLVTLLTVVTLTFSSQSYAQGWFDSLKNMLGFGEETPVEVAPNSADMVNVIAKNLGVNAEQARGGLGSIFNYVKGNLADEKYEQLSGILPGIDNLIDSAPDYSELQETGGLSGLMDKAAEYNESLKAINAVKKQFAALGLEPQMIMQYVQQAKIYLDSEQGQQAKSLLIQGLSGLTG